MSSDGSEAPCPGVRLRQIPETAMVSMNPIALILPVDGEGQGSGCSGRCVLDTDVAHPSLSIYLPALNGIVVIKGMDPSDRQQGRTSRLYVSGFVDAPALDDGF